jgi:glyoxylate/hydroxypyruvate reductase A
MTRAAEGGHGMALLIVNLDKMIGTAEEWRNAVAEHLPRVALRIWPEANDLSEIEYLAFIRPDFDVIPPLPNLKAMFSRSAGVEAFIHHPRLPKVPLGKLEPSGGDPMMTEYTVMHVLRLHREMPKYQAAQANREWLRTRIVRPEERRIGFLGLGLMATAPALILRQLGFPVSAWVRSPRPPGEGGRDGRGDGRPDGIKMFHGEAQFEAFMGQTDIAVCLLPLTRETEGIFCARSFAMMPRGAMVINIGRGGHVVDVDLIAALDSGQLSHAALDALKPEPLPSDSPLWTHPRVTVMPHVARRPTVHQLVAELAANIRSVEAGGGLLQQIDLAREY